MSVHKLNINSKSDCEFLDGELKYIVKGNECRLLDGRRTPGYIEDYYHETGMFRWRITDFEDQGKHWDVPAEKIKQFQILKDSKTLEETKIDEIEAKILEFDQDLLIEMDSNKRIKAERDITQTEKKVMSWLDETSQFFKNSERLDLDHIEGNQSLMSDLKAYMKSVGLDAMEEETASQMVLNPNSEWIKGMTIILAEMGLVRYQNKIPRGNLIFEGTGAKALRRKYLVHRIAFVRAFFHKLAVNEVTIYRGMSTENEWQNFVEKSLTSWTFSLKVTMVFSDLEKANKYKNGYILKRTIPVEYLFMTYLETEEMNKQYKEAEAILFFNREKGIY